MRHYAHLHPAHYCLWCASLRKSAFCARCTCIITQTCVFRPPHLVFLVFSVFPVFPASPAPRLRIPPRPIAVARYTREPNAVNRGRKLDLRAKSGQTRSHPAPARQKRSIAVARHTREHNAVNRGRKKTLVHLTTVRRRSSGQCERGTSERAAGERGKFCVGRARAAQSALVDRYLCHEVARKIARRMPGEPSAREHIRSAMRSRRRRRRQAQTAATQSRPRAKRQLIARQGWGSGRGASSGAPLPKHTSQTRSHKNTVGISRQGGTIHLIVSMHF